VPSLPAKGRLKKKSAPALLSAVCSNKADRLSALMASLLSYSAVAALRVDSQILLALVYVIFALCLGGTAWVASRQQNMIENTIEK